MVNILDNKLVIKYFGFSSSGKQRTNLEIAFLVLQAVQEPINLGQKYLYVEANGDIREMEMLTQANHPPFFYHPNYLRLPDKYQPKTVDDVQKHECDWCMKEHRKHSQPQRDEESK